MNRTDYMKALTRLAMSLFGETDPRMACRLWLLTGIARGTEPPTPSVPVGKARYLVRNHDAQVRARIKRNGRHNYKTMLAQAIWDV